MFKKFLVWLSITFKFGSAYKNYLFANNFKVSSSCESLVYWGNTLICKELYDTYKKYEYDNSLSTVRNFIKHLDMNNGKFSITLSKLFSDGDLVFHSTRYVIVGYKGEDGIINLSRGRHCEKEIVFFISSEIKSIYCDEKGYYVVEI